jgi:hypothetical protein
MTQEQRARSWEGSEKLTVEWRGALVVPEQQLDDLPVDGGVVHHQHAHRRRLSSSHTHSPSPLSKNARNGPLLSPLLAPTSGLAGRTKDDGPGRGKTARLEPVNKRNDGDEGKGSPRNPGPRALTCISLL